MFTYHASVMGLGGVVQTDNGPVDIPSQGSAVLPPTGGSGAALVRDFDEGGVYARKIQTSVSGREKGSQYVTTSEVTISSLDVQGRVHADTIWAYMESTRDINAPAQVLEDSTFTFRATIIGLRANGEDLAPALDVEIFINRDCAAFLEHVTSPDLADTYGQRFGWGPEVRQRMRVLAGEMRTNPTLAASKMNRPIRASFLDGINERSLVARHRDGYALPIPHVGRLHLAEVLLKPGRRRVNMLRFDFNKGLMLDTEGGEAPAADARFFTSSNASTASGGTLTVASVEGNGIPTNP